jgi:16S rRNA (cytosine1402-N4)-methyltransferase
MFQHHTPVLLKEVLDYLKPKNEGVYLDATFGGGGYTKGIFQYNEHANVIGFDKDHEAIERAEAFKSTYSDRFAIFHDSFANASTYISPQSLDGAVFDLGVSSYQLDDAKRGFSFQKNGPLDMRMSDTGQTAECVLNTYGEKELADIFYYYGEERKAYQIARSVVRMRETTPLTCTQDLVQCVLKVTPHIPGKSHPATRAFQAIRIYLNNELQDIQDGLQNLLPLLKNGAHVVVVTFHSLEDRIVKNFFKINQHFLLPLHKKTIFPSDEEIQENSRARSAKLRACQCAL